MDKYWNEIDKNVVEELEKQIRYLEISVWKLKRAKLAIESKYQLPESKEPHNQIR